MDTQQLHCQVPKFRFRVLIIGRANAGKTSILQKLCETTESPILDRIFRRKEKVKLNPSMDRGEHSIDDELVFSNHKGYVFHDSRGIESGSAEELGILQEFIRRKCGETRLQDRLHTIWYCVPMDNQRPQLDLKFFKGICFDQNVPVIAVFTKYDQFLRNVEMHLVDYPNEYPGSSVSEVAEKQFQEHYVNPLGEDVKFVRLEKMHKKDTRCNDLIERTAAALNGNIVASMLLAVQRSNLEFSVIRSLKRVRSHARVKVEGIVRECLIPFPYIWFFSGSRSGRFKEEEREFRLGGREFFGRLRLLLREDEFRELLLELDRLVMRVVSLPTIQNITTIGLSHDHLILAVILILKHTTFLCLSNLSPESALTQAELDYREGGIDSGVQQYLKASSQEHSVDLFADFIMDTDIVPSQS